MPEIRGDSSILHELCIPPRSRSQLIELLGAAEQSDLNSLSRPPPPHGYTLCTSRSTGLYYLTAGGKNYFDWRELRPVCPLPCEIEDLPLPTLETAGNWCRFCQEIGGEGHAELERHCALKRLWQRCVELVKDMKEDLAVHLMPTEASRTPQYDHTIFFADSVLGIHVIQKFVHA